MAMRGLSSLCVVCALICLSCSNPSPTQPSATTAAGPTAVGASGVEGPGGTVVAGPLGRVGNVGGGGSDCPGCPIGQFLVTAASGDSLAGSCVVDLAESVVQATQLCALASGTGRFAGAFTIADGTWAIDDANSMLPPPPPFFEWFQFLPTGSSQVAFIALFVAPRLGSSCDSEFVCHNGVLLQGTFSAQSETTSVPVDVCPQGSVTSIHMQGPIQGIGRSTAQFWYCTP